MKQELALSTGIIVVLFIFGCGCMSAEEQHPPPGGQKTIGNPASLYCHSMGYESEIRTDANGSQSGVCRMPNGTEVDEWEFYRSAHPEN